jgi:hypothetical protein
MRHHRQWTRYIELDEFIATLYDVIADSQAKAVTGPGRSGAIAAVHASHYLGIPFIPFGRPTPLRPLLIVDTAVESGRTMRKAWRKYGGTNIELRAAFHEPPRVKFWYERKTRCGYDPD